MNELSDNRFSLSALWIKCKIECWQEQLMDATTEFPIKCLPQKWIRVTILCEHDPPQAPHTFYVCELNYSSHRKVHSIKCTLINKTAVSSFQTTYYAINRFYDWEVTQQKAIYTYITQLWNTPRSLNRTALWIVRKCILTLEQNFALVPKLE